jgi:hypothetical protein
MTDGSTELGDKLIPVLKEYDLTDIIMALSLKLLDAVNIASKAPKPNREMAIALEYAEEKAFRIRESALQTLKRG